MHVYTCVCVCDQEREVHMEVCVCVLCISTSLCFMPAIFLITLKCSAAPSLLFALCYFSSFLHSACPSSTLPPSLTAWALQTTEETSVDNVCIIFQHFHNFRHYFFGCFFVASLVAATTTATAATWAASTRVLVHCLRSMAKCLLAAAAVAAMAAAAT